VKDTAFLWIRVFALMVAISLVPCELIGQDSNADQGSASATTSTAAEIKAKILAECHYPKDISDEKQLKKALDCVQGKVATLKRDIVVGRSLDATINRMYGISAPSPAQPRGQGPSQAPSPAPPSEPSYAGQSASNTPSTCGPGNLA
jgi:hypothetical protein